MAQLRQEGEFSMLKYACLLIVLLVAGVAPAQAGFLGDLWDTLVGKPAYVVGLTGGSAELSLMLWSDKSMTVPRQLWFDQAGNIHILKRASGPLMYGMVTFTDGSGKTAELSAKLDSSDWFERVEPMLANEDMDQWLRRRCGEQMVQDGDRVRFLNFSPFVSYKVESGQVKGPVFIVLDTAKLATGFSHTLYVRTTVRQGRNVLPPAETKVRFFVESDQTPIGRWIKEQEDNPQAQPDQIKPANDLGDIAPSTPAPKAGETTTSTPSTTPTSIELSADAQKWLAYMAANVGLPSGDLLSPCTFKVRANRIEDPALGHLVFFLITREGELVKEALSLNSTCDRSGQVAGKDGGVFYLHRLAGAEPGSTWWFTHRGRRYEARVPTDPTLCAWVPAIEN